MITLPCAADTLVISFRFVRDGGSPRRVAQMSRMRRACELFERGVVRAPTVTGTREASPNEMLGEEDLFDEGNFVLPEAL